MRTRGRRRSRWRIVTASTVIALGVLMVTAGVAAASSPVGEDAVVTFWDNYNVVTLRVPAECPMQQPNCLWMLWVNEPDIPAQTVVGYATGTSGILTVAYPTNFCGVIQADVLAGPNPWRLLFGHRTSIQTGSCTCPTTQSASSAGTVSSPGSTGSVSIPSSTGSVAHPSRARHAAPLHRRSLDRPARRSSTHDTATTTTTDVGGTTTTTDVGGTTTTTTNPGDTTIQDTSCAPITSEANVVPAPAQLPFTGTASTVSAPQSQPQAALPFTGVDVKPLMIAGSFLILLGLSLQSTVERRRALRSAVASVRSSRAAAGWTRTARWFLGE